MTHSAKTLPRRSAAVRGRWILGTTLASLLLAGSGTAAAVDGPSLGRQEPIAAASAAQDEARSAWAQARQVGLPAAQASGWTTPLADKARISQRYGVKGNWAAGHHTGVDFAVPEGTPVRSVGSGSVVFAGTSGDYGRAVTIRMSDGKYTLFAHLSRISVAKGERVNAGKVIGRSGNTGNSTGPHLHFEVRAQRGYGSDIDPLKYLASHGVQVP